MNRPDPTTTSTPDLETGGRAGPLNARQFLLLIVQLALVLWVVYEFAIEERRHLPAVLALALAGFAVHAWLPMPLRMPLFLALSIASLPLVLPWQDALYVLGLGSGLAAINWLPVSARLRVVLLLLAAGNLAVWRDGSDRPFWPILGAMFMFRLILYVFETRDQPRGGFVQSLSYFFLLPNACFTLFPVIDYATFRRTYYDQSPYGIYQTGVDWIVRGLTHLLLYRVIKYYVLPSPNQLGDPAQLALFLAANYALYLRVSGQFHLITGLLHLFGFNLPPTHRLYFLATSPSDIWRRINIYWKEFMQKVFFLPAFFALRRYGTPAAMALATCCVFVATWVLHSYQLFWLIGEFSLTTPDALLWLSVGVVVALNSLFDYRRARRSAENPAPQDVERCLSPGGALRRSVQTLAMFTAVSLFWGRWTDPGVFKMMDWPLGSLLRETHSLLKLGAVVIGILLAGTVCQLIYCSLPGRSSLEAYIRPAFAGFNTAILALLAILGTPQGGELFGPQVAPWVAGIQSDLPTVMEASRFVPGYYEVITEADLQSAAYREALHRQRQGFGPLYVTMTRPRSDMLELELIPNWRGEFAGKRLTVNRLGMRDRDVEQIKPPDTTRIALVGSSIVMGYGVEDDEVFKELLENRLNTARAPAQPAFELLNFGAGGYWAVHRRMLIDLKVFSFEPDAIFYFAHQDEFMGVIPHLSKYLDAGHTMPYPCLEEVVRRAGVTEQTSFGAIRALLTPRAHEILQCTYGGIVAECRQRGIAAVWVFLPMPGIADAPMSIPQLIKLAEDAGFVVIDLSNWSEGYAPEDVKLNEKDHHANALGHQLIASRLFEALQKRPEALPKKP